MAAPKKSDKDKRSLRLPNVRCSEHEHRIIVRKANQANMSVSEYLRSCALNRKITVRQDNVPKEMIYQLTMIGNNLNQLVKKYHGTGQEPSSLRGMLEKLRVFLDKIFTSHDHKD